MLGEGGVWRCNGANHPVVPCPSQVLPAGKIRVGR